VCCIPNVSEDRAASIFRVEESRMKMHSLYTLTGLVMPDSWERQRRANAQCNPTQIDQIYVFAWDEHVKPKINYKDTAWHRYKHQETYH
jgi:hypothetical protein